MDNWFYYIKNDEVDVLNGSMGPWLALRSLNPAIRVQSSVGPFVFHLFSFILLEVVLKDYVILP